MTRVRRVDSSNLVVAPGQEAISRELAVPVTTMLGTEEPDQAEMAAFAIASFVAAHSATYLDDMINEYIPLLVAYEQIEMLVALGSVFPGPIRQAATEAVAELIAAGVAEPAWVAPLHRPVVPDDCFEVTGAQPMLIFVYSRAGRWTAGLMLTDRQRCGAAHSVVFISAASRSALQDVLDRLIERAAPGSVSAPLDPAEFRRRGEAALSAQEVHNRATSSLAAFVPASDDDPTLVPGLPLYSLLMQARMRALPQPSGPPAPHRPTASCPAVDVRAARRHRARVRRASRVSVRR